MEADHVGLVQQFLEADARDAVTGVEFRVRHRVERDDPHSERDGTRGHGAADAAESDEAHRLAANRPGQDAAPTAALDKVVVIHDVRVTPSNRENACSATLS